MHSWITIITEKYIDKTIFDFFPVIWFCADSDVIYHAILPGGCGGGNAEMLVSWQEFLISYVSRAIPSYLVTCLLVA